MKLSTVSLSLFLAAVSIAAPVNADASGVSLSREGSTGPDLSNSVNVEKKSVLDDLSDPIENNVLGVAKRQIEGEGEAEGQGEAEGEGQLGRGGNGEGEGKIGGKIGGGGKVGGAGKIGGEGEAF